MTTKQKRRNLPLSKKGKPMSKQAMFSKISSGADIIIATLFAEMEHGDNSNARIGAAKVLINKILPDLKVTELVGNTDKPIGVVVLPNLNETKDNMATPPRPPDPSPKED